MFIGYMKDMKSWILFFLGTIGFIDLVLWLDQGIIVEVTSILYFNILLLLFFIVFLAWRYYVEMKFTKELVLLIRSEEHTSELQSRGHLVCRLLLEKKKKKYLCLFFLIINI